VNIFVLFLIVLFFGSVLVQQHGVSESCMCRRGETPVETSEVKGVTRPIVP
jgi:hypothetical protein